MHNNFCIRLCSSSRNHLHLYFGGAAIAQWICLCLPFYHPWFESQAQNLRFYQFILRCGKDKNKQKEAGIGPFKNYSHYKSSQEMVAFQALKLMQTWWGASMLFWAKRTSEALYTEATLHLVHCCCFLKRANPGHFLFLFSLFSRHNSNNTNWKKHRWSAWESNPGPQDGRRRRNHGAMAATQHLVHCLWLVKVAMHTKGQNHCIDSQPTSSKMVKGT